MSRYDLTGWFFLGYDRDGDLESQGEILGHLNDTHLVAQFYSWVDQSPTLMVVPVVDIERPKGSKTGWRLFPREDWWREEAETGLRILREKGSADRA